MCVCVCVCVSPALVEGVDVDAVVFVLLQDLLGVVVGVEGVHEDERHVGVERFVQMLQHKTKRDNRVESVLNLGASRLLALIVSTSICWTVRSRKVFSLRTLIRLLGPLQPMLVPRPPFSLTTASLLRLAVMLSGRPFALIFS